MARRGLRGGIEYQQLDSISDASVDKRANLIGVILERSLPKMSNGTDHWCLVGIIDESYDTRGFIVNFFGKSMDLLPQVESVGDIIQLCQVVIRRHKDELNAVFYKGSSAFALYEGKHGQNFTPYQVSSNFHSQEQDKMFVADLRTWINIVDRDAIVPNESILLRGIRKLERLDLCCKILHQCRDNEGGMMLFVWDGTNAPPCDIHDKLDNEMESPLPLQLEGVSLSRDIVSTFPTAGTVLRVKVELELHSSTLIVGRWVKLIGLFFGVESGLWYGIFDSYARIKYLQDEDRRVLKFLRDHNNRLSSKWDRMPFTCFPWPGQVRETEKPDLALVTLMDIINYSQVTAKFKCIVRVVAMLPSDPKDFRSPNGTYRIRLTLEDPTARIHAYLYAKDAEYFFHGYPDIDELTRKRNKFLGIAETDGSNEGEAAARNPPWMFCLIKSYYLDEANKWGSRNYRVYGTKVLCQ